MGDVTTAQVARSIKIAPRTKRFVLRDDDGLAYSGGRTEHVLAALSRSDRSDLPCDVHTVAWAVLKSYSTARMRPGPALRLLAMSPYQVCGLVAAVARECPETTTGGICDDWLPKHIERLTS